MRLEIDFLAMSHVILLFLDQNYVYKTITF